MMTTAGLQTCHAHTDTKNDVIDYLTTYRIYNQNVNNNKIMVIVLLSKAFDSSGL